MPRLIDADALIQWILNVNGVPSRACLGPHERVFVSLIDTMPTINVDVLNVVQLVPKELLQGDEDNFMDKIVAAQLAGKLADKIIETADITKSLDTHHEAFRYETRIAIVREVEKEDGRS